MIVVACETILLIEVLKLESSWAGDELSNASELGGEVAILKNLPERNTRQVVIKTKPSDAQVIRVFLQSVTLLVCN